MTGLNCDLWFLSVPCLLCLPEIATCVFDSWQICGEDISTVLFLVCHKMCLAPPRHILCWSVIDNLPFEFQLVTQNGELQVTVSGWNVRLCTIFAFIFCLNYIYAIQNNYYSRTDFTLWTPAIWNLLLVTLQLNYLYFIVFFLLWCDVSWWLLLLLSVCNIVSVIFIESTAKWMEETCPSRSLFLKLCSSNHCNKMNLNASTIRTSTHLCRTWTVLQFLRLHRTTYDPKRVEGLMEPREWEFTAED